MLRIRPSVPFTPTTPDQPTGREDRGEPRYKTHLPDIYLGVLHLWQGQPAGAMAYLERGVVLARAQTRASDLGEALIFLGAARLAPEPPHQLHLLGLATAAGGEILVQRLVLHPVPAGADPEAQPPAADTPPLAIPTPAMEMAAAPRTPAATSLEWLRNDMAASTILQSLGRIPGDGATSRPRIHDTLGAKGE